MDPHDNDDAGKVPQGVFLAPDDPTLIGFVRGLTADGTAAVELLGELAPSTTAEGRERIRIPNVFPLPAHELEAFCAEAERIGLLVAVGVNENGIHGRVWELRQQTYERILGMMGELGMFSVTTEPGPVPDASPADEPAVSEASETTGDLPDDLGKLRELLASAQRARQTNGTQSEHLRTLYRETSQELVGVTDRIAELRRRLPQLHARRLELKREVRAANVGFTLACSDVKRITRQIGQLERAAVDAASDDIALIIRNAAESAGISVDQLIGAVRKKVSVP